MCKSLAKAQAQGQQEIDEANHQIRINDGENKATTAKIKGDKFLVDRTKRNADSLAFALKIRKGVNKFREYATRATGALSKVSLTDANQSNRANRNKYNAVMAMVSSKEALAETAGGEKLRRDFNRNTAIYKAQMAKSLEKFIPQPGSPGRFWADQNQFMRTVNTINQVASAATSIYSGGKTMKLWGV